MANHCCMDHVTVRIHSMTTLSNGNDFWCKLVRSTKHLFCRAVPAGPQSACIKLLPSCRSPLHQLSMSPATTSASTASAQARCTERMNLWQSCENSAATLAASRAPRRLATEPASQPVTAALAASRACTAAQESQRCRSYKKQPVHGANEFCGRA